MRKLIPYVVVTGGILGAFVVACGSDTTNTPGIDPGGNLQDTDSGVPGTPEPGKDSGTPDSGPTTPPAATDFAIGGKVTGLKGTGMVLQNNGGDDLSVNADGTFVFKNKLAKGKPFAVTVKNQPTAPSQTCTVSGGTGTVASANVTTVAINCATDTFTIGGNVSGLAGTGLVLQNNAGDDATIAADGSFAFATPVADGGDYAVTVKTQPTGLSQTCTVTSDKGKVAGKNVTDVAVTCVTNKFTVGGTVAGLKGTGLSLKNNAGDDLAVAADGTFTFATSLNDGSDFAVTVGTSPTGPTQTCTVSGGTGKIAGGNITTVTVNCSTETYAVGGTVSGLAGTGLVLQNNAGNDLAVNANGTFAFTTPVADLAGYAVTVKTQPTGKWQTCTVANGTGNVAGAPITNVAITCTTNAYKVKGTVTGLAGTGLKLQNNAGNDLAITQDGAFEFTTSLASGSTYLVTTLTNPANKSQTCTVTNGTGTIAGADVTNVAVACVTNKYTIGGTVTGLAAGNDVVLTNNAGDDATVSADGSFTFATGIESGQTFDVLVKTQPSSPNQTCTVSGGSGTVAAGNVVTVAVNCATDKYTAGGTISGLDGTGLVLQNNAGGDLAFNNNGTFAMAPQDDGTAYAITVKTQPTAKSQTCTVSNGTGTINGADATSVGVSCVTNKYDVGGSVTGLTGTVVLTNNGGDDKSIAANGAFKFNTQVASGGAYAVAVKTQPAGLYCAVSNASGTVTNGAVSNIGVTCIAPTSCLAIKTLDPAATDGTYSIDPDGAGPLGSLSVWCDMTTDGGGYTSYAITGGISTSRYDQANSCTALGLKLAIPRTKAHLDALFAKYGIGSFKVVPGVYGLAAGNYTGCAMNSTDATCSANWKALDGGQWFAKKAAYSEPNGDYTPGCWLGLDGNGVDASGFVRFNDLGCGYSTGANYVCSDNVKGGPLELMGVQQNLPVANLNGWTQCYLDTYDKNDGQLAQEIVAACTKPNIMLACRPTGSATLTLAAQAPRADVFFDTGTGNTPHNANNVGWYFNNNYSMGFAPQGDAISRNSADTNAGPTRLSWHTHSNYSTGYRCGDVYLNSNASYERVVYQAD